MSQHDVINALPVGSPADKALTRALLTKRYAYCFDTGEAVTAWVAVDPADGSLPLYIVQNNILFRYDSTDSTTTNDGVTCCVSSDGKRYKVASVVFPYFVLSVATAAQPGSPTIGDAYLLPAGSTGTNWAGNDNKIAVFTARGWFFITPDVGRLVYNTANDSYYHKNAGGSWVLGFGTQTLATGGVFPYNMHGGGGKVRYYIENQTTNAPPGSPADAVEYIVGPSPTGAWAGQAGKIARFEAGAWAFYAPLAGWRAYDKAQAQEYVYSGAAWVTGNGNLAVTRRKFATPGTATWNKPARLAFVLMHVIGGGGGSQGSTTGGGVGGTSSFGAHAVATGTTGVTTGNATSPPTPGVGSSGDLNLAGNVGGWNDGSTNVGVPGGLPGLHFGTFGVGGRLTGAIGAQGWSGSGAGAETKYVLAATLGSSETVTVGAGGTAGGGGGIAGGTGVVIVDEYTFA